jgi:hypothetical protein
LAPSFIFVWRNPWRAGHVALAAFPTIFPPIFPPTQSGHYVAVFPAIERMADAARETQKEARRLHKDGAGPRDFQASDDAVPRLCTCALSE